MKYIVTWRRASLVLPLVFFALSVRWSVLDNSPPAWDQGLYLYQSAGLQHVLKENGFWSFWEAFFNIDRGRVPLMLAIVQPAFYFFGVSLDVAVISLNFCWFILAWSIHGIIRLIAVNVDVEKAFFFSFAFFGLYPLTVMLSHNFLVEFFLSTWVCAAVYSALMLFQTRRIVWSIIIGFFVSLGLLTKVTFVVFLFPIVGVVLFRLFREISFRDCMVLTFPAFTVVAVIACPYYFYNMESIFEMTTFLSSKKLADLYGFGNVFEFETIFNYWGSVFVSPVFFLTACLIIFAGIGFYKDRKDSLLVIEKWNLFYIGVWFFIPFVLATLGEIKDPRYLFPALIPIFIVSGIAAARIFAFDAYGVISAFFAFFLLLPSYLYSNAILSEQSFSRFVDGLGVRMLRSSDLAPDTRFWDVRQLVEKIYDYLDKKIGNNKIIFLGGGRYYHLRLLDYEGLMAGVAIQYLTLPYYTDPAMSLDKAIDFIYSSESSGVLFKTGENWPKFSSRLDVEITDILRKNSKYIAHDLGIQQPDGSRFIYFQNKAFLTVPILSASDLSGPWQVGGGVAEIDAQSEEEISIKTETGLQSFAVIREGLIVVASWGVSGAITADGGSIRWTNGSVWQKASAR